MKTDAASTGNFMPDRSGLEVLETQVRSRLYGQVQRFHVRVRGCGLVLTGHAHTYYAKQLAQHAVMTTTRLPIVANEIQVS